VIAAESDGSVPARAGRNKCSIEKVKLTRSGGNVFRDLGFSGDEAEYLKVRAELMLNVQKVITARGLAD
jgi:predicted XRE-type DNA-binding protein